MPKIETNMVEVRERRFNWGKRHDSMSTIFPMQTFALGLNRRGRIGGWREGCINIKQSQS
jgi:hypothetical protein